jgi:glycosyltransferase involved in cell wall biosynthesis
MKVHVLQHGLEDMHSHYYGESVHLQKAIEAMGAQCLLYTYSGCEPALLKSLNGRPIFPHPPDRGFDPDPVSKELSSFLVCGPAFGTALVQHLPRQFAPDDWVLVPYASHIEAYGLGLWLNGIPVDARPKVALFCHRPELGWKMDEAREKIQANASFWRVSGRQMVHALGADRCVLATGDARLAHFLGEFSTMKTVVSGLATAYFLSPEEVSRRGRDVDIGMMGEYRPERGKKLVPQTLAQIDRLQPGLSYRVQIHTPEDKAELLSELKSLGFQGRLEVADGMLSPQQFDHLLAGSRLVVLPYLFQRYAMRTSGVLSQATAYGIPCVVPAQTWLSDVVDSGQAAGQVFDSWTAPSVAAATVAAWQQLPALTAKAAALADPWRLKNSAASVITNMMHALKLARP